MTPVKEKKSSGVLSPALAPKFVDNEELRAPGTYQRLFGQPDGGRVSGESRAERDLRSFKQMHFCARRMRMLAKQYGDAVEGQDDYRRYAAIHKRIRDELAAENIGLVYDLYKRSHVTNVDGDDLLSEGMMALTRAIYTFNPWRGFRFSTYACNAIIRAFYRCGLKEARRREHEPISHEEQRERSDWLETRRAYETNLYAERLNRLLTNGTVRFSSCERAVLERRFPLDGGAPRRTLSAIGRDLKLSKERVRQIQNSALEKLREALTLDPVLR